MRQSALAAGALGLGSGCSDDVAPNATDGGDTDTTQVAVSLVKSGDVDADVRRSIELAGGLDAIRPGDTVFIKTNAVHSFATENAGIATSNDVLAAVIRAVRNQSPGHVTVGDRSSRPFESADTLERIGQTAAALDAGADEVYGAPKPRDRPGDWVLVQPPFYEETWDEAGGILAMRRIIEADHFINLPVCKNHRWAAFSLAMKNLIGAVGDDSRDPMHYVENDPDRLSRDIVILNQAFSPLMTILDAQTAILNGGPEGILNDAVFHEFGAMLASTDRVALDVVGAALIQLGLQDADVPRPDPMHERLTTTSAWDLPQITEGIALGIGLQDGATVDLVAEGFEDSDRLVGLLMA